MMILSLLNILPPQQDRNVSSSIVVVNVFAASGMKVKQTVDKMANVADSLSEGGSVNVMHIDSSPYS